MFRDNSLIPTEAVRLAALGFLAEAPRRYGDLAAEIRHFTGRVVGPSLDLMGTSLELMRFEGLIEAVDGVDVLFSEIKLKDDALAGVRLAQQAARRRPGMRVLYASEHGTSDRLKLLLGQSPSVLEKPYTVGELKRGVSAQLSQ